MPLYLDTCIVIYLVEEYHVYCPVIETALADTTADFVSVRWWNWNASSCRPNTITHCGMMIAILEEHWQVFAMMSAAAFAATLLQLAHKVRLRAFRKHPRGPKKPSPKRHNSAQQPHVSTARLLRQQRAQSGTP
jgi:hypothetical protein